MPADESARILARLLREAAPKSDAEALAAALLRRHGSLSALMETATEDLAKTPGMTEASARLVTLVPALARYLEKERAAGIARVRSFREAGDYLKGLYIGRHNEHFYLLCLGAVGEVISCPLVQQGTLDEAPFYPRRLLELATRCRAEAVVLSHNHPSGTARPSQPDVQSTLTAFAIFAPLGILVLDHIIVADGTPLSVRQSGLIPEALFLGQAPESFMVNNWLR